MAVDTAQQTQTRTTWAIDPAHSLVEFSTRHMMVTTVKGSFKGIKGTITEIGSDPATAEVDAEIDVTSITTSVDQRDTHLRSADFFDADNFPTITFKSTRIEKLADDHYTVHGDLTIRDVTREVELDTTINGQGKTPFGIEVVGFTGETTLNRKDFGLNWNVALETGGWLVGDKIKVTLEIEATKQV